MLVTFPPGGGAPVWIPPDCPVCTLYGKTYDVVNGQPRLRPERIEHPKPGKKPTRTVAA